MKDIKSKNNDYEQALELLRKSDVVIETLTRAVHETTSMLKAMERDRDTWKRLAEDSISVADKWQQLAGGNVIDLANDRDHWKETAQRAIKNLKEWQDLAEGLKAALDEMKPRVIN